MESQNSKGKGNRKSRSKKNAVFHYTNSEGLIGIIQSKRIWFTSKHCSNDSSEFKYALHTVLHNLIHEELSSKFDSEKSNMFAQFLINQLTELMDDGLFENFLNFIACFSSVNRKNEYENGLLSQWRGYGNYAIEFDKKELCDELTSTKKAVFNKISYDGTGANEYSEILRLRLVPLIEKFIRFNERNDINFTQAYNDYKRHLSDIIIPLWNMAAFTKSPDFQEENEYRLLDLSLGSDCKFYSRNGFIIPYVESRTEITPFITRIIVGPGQRIDSRVESVKILLKSEALEKQVDVTKSAITFEKG